MFASQDDSTNGDITTHYSAFDVSRLQEYVDRLVDQRATVLRIGSRGARQSGAKMGQGTGQSAPLGKPQVSA